MVEYNECTVQKVIYQDTRNMFVIFKCKTGDERLSAKGYIMGIHEGMILKLKGDFEKTQKYGSTFVVNNWEEVLPSSKSGILAYLSANSIKGIGKSIANDIVNNFGEQTFEIFDNNIDLLLTVRGIGKKKLEKIKKSWDETRHIRNIMLFFGQFGVSQAMAARIYKEYGINSINIVKMNPYRLISDIHGYGFKTVDMIAMRLGIKEDSYQRISNGILYVLREASNSGHIFLPCDELSSVSQNLLDVSKEKVEEAMEKMYETEDIFRDYYEDIQIIYLPSLYKMECAVAENIKRVMETPLSSSRDNAGRKLLLLSYFNKFIEKTSKEYHVEYDDMQINAIKKAITSKIMVLTGGPGTGKTTTICGIIRAFKSMGCDIALAAPTGRAAKRMSEVTGENASTIHRLLEYTPEGFSRNEDNPLEEDVIIIDETSMVDIPLMHALMRAIDSETQVIFSGDIDQLPSVGPGNVLRDMINSQKIPVVSLTTIFRQAQDSKIVMNAHRINQGEFPVLNGGKDSDFFFLEKQDSMEIAENIIKYVSKNLPEYYKKSANDIQVITPMRKGDIGVINLNKMLQQAINPIKPNQQVINRNGYSYHVGDKIMQIKNDYDKGVFNGDVGIVTYISQEDGELEAEFDGIGFVGYELSDLDDIVLAYAITVHKSQGTEYPIVVMPVAMEHYVMLQRNLIYTAITRAKEVMFIIGQKKAIKIAIDKNVMAKRNTLLAKRLNKCINNPADYDFIKMNEVNKENNEEIIIF